MLEKEKYTSRTITCLMVFTCAFSHTRLENLLMPLPYCCSMSFAVLVNEKLEQDGDDAPSNTSNNQLFPYQGQYRPTIKTLESCIDLWNLHLMEHSLNVSHYCYLLFSKS